MATASVTYTFAAAAQIKSAEFNTNFSDLVTFLNSNVVHKDGAITMTGRLTLATLDPTSADHAVRRAYTDKLRTNVKLRRAANQSTTSSIYNTISWDTEDFDPEGWIGVPSGTLTVPAGAAGDYIVTAIGTFDAFAITPAAVKIIVAGRSMSVQQYDYPNGITWSGPLAVGNTIQFQVLQSNGATSNWTGALYVTRVGSLG